MSRVLAHLFDHAFDLLPSLLLLAVAMGSRRMEFAAPPG